MNKYARLLLIEINRRPLLAFLGKEQPPYLSSHVWIAGGDLLQIRIGHRNAPGYRPSTVRP